MEKIIIDNRLDVLIVNDLQKDFLESFPHPEPEIISKKIVSILHFFHLNNIYFFLHAHNIEIFKDCPNLRHGIVFPKIVLQNSENKNISQLGISEGFEFDENLYAYLKKEVLKGNSFKIFHKMKCPILGVQFSVLNACNIDEHLLKNKARRIFFSGFNLSPCIMNEIFYLSHKDNFEIFIIKDLVGFSDEKDKMVLLESLKSRRINCINSNQLFK